MGIPDPEMMFRNKLLRITHRPSGWTYAFRVADALRGVKSGPLEDGDGGVKVGYADAWHKSRWVSHPASAYSALTSRRTGLDSKIPMPQMVATKPYWTYMTTYAGSFDDAGSSNDTELAQWTPGEPSDVHHSIPVAGLSRPDPILFCAKIPLFDEATAHRIDRKSVV